MKFSDFLFFFLIWKASRTIEKFVAITRIYFLWLGEKFRRARKYPTRILNKILKNDGFTSGLVPLEKKTTAALPERQNSARVGTGLTSFSKEKLAFFIFEGFTYFSSFCASFLSKFYSFTSKKNLERTGQEGSS